MNSGGGDAGESSTSPSVAAEAAKTSDPPTGAAGFRFGQSLDEARHACSEAEGMFQELEAKRFRCSKLPEDVGIEARADLTFCTDALCGIEIAADPEKDGRGAMAVYASFASALAKKYGAPKERENEIESDCQEPKAFSVCLREGRVSISQSWRWPGGTRMRMSLERQGEGGC